MNQIDSIIALIDESLDSYRKRHIVGGILLSISLLFGGLAVTTITIKSEEIKWVN